MMDDLMRPMTRYEVEQLMKKVGIESARVLRKFKEKMMELEVGDEAYQCFLSALPKVQELRNILNSMDANRMYDIRETINGYKIVRMR